MYKKAIKNSVLAGTLTFLTLVGISVSFDVVIVPLQAFAWLVAVLFLILGYLPNERDATIHVIYMVVGLLVFRPSLEPVIALDDTPTLFICVFSAVISLLSPFVLSGLGSAFVGARQVVYGGLVIRSVITYLVVVGFLVVVSSLFQISSTFYIVGLFWFSVLSLGLFSFWYGRMAAR